MNLRELIATLIEKLMNDPTTPIEERQFMEFFTAITTANDAEGVENAWSKLLMEENNKVGLLLVRCLLSSLSRVDANKLTSDALLARVSFRILKAFSSVDNKDHFMPALAKLLCNSLETIKIDPIEIILYIVPAKNDFDQSKASSLDLAIHGLIVDIFKIYEGLKESSQDEDINDILTAYIPYRRKDFFSPN